MGRVAVTGIGVVSPLGCSVHEMVRGVIDTSRGDVATHRNQESSGTHASEDPPAYGESLECNIPVDVIPADKRTRIGRLDRLCRLFLTASYLSTADAGLCLAPEDEELVGLSFGTGLGCLLTDAEYYDKVVEQGPGAASPRLFAYTVSNAAAGEVSIALGIKGPNATHHLGLAAGLGALGYGFDLIEMGKAEVMLAGGADANGPVIVEALRHMGLLKRRHQARPFRDAVPGLWPSEGAAVLVLETATRAARRSARVWGYVAGYAAGFEPSLASRAAAATGLIETMRRALAQSGLAAAEVDVIVASAHGTPVDAAERAAIREVFGNRPLVLASKAVFGEAFGASAVLGVALAAGLMQTEVHSAVASAVADAEPSLFRQADGRVVDTNEAVARMRSAAIVMAQATCYSGNLVSLVFTRGA